MNYAEKQEMVSYTENTRDYVPPNSANPDLFTFTHFKGVQNVIDKLLIASNGNSNWLEANKLIDIKLEAD